MRMIFDGWIAGLGTTAGLRCVIGHWRTSPLGPFTDVMVEHPDGHRVLLAPSRAVADFVSATYSFDEVITTTVALTGPAPRWELVAGPLRASIDVSRRLPLGYLLRAVPRRLATSTWWITAVDLVARQVMPGVRTRGSARDGRQEYYAALDMHRLNDVQVRWKDVDQGRLSPIDPPVRFGFGSTPRRPSLVRIVTRVST